MPVVGTLRVAPVKGLATVLRESVLLDEQGVAEDRRVFLLDAGGSVITLRSHPQLVGITPDLDLQAGVLSVTLPDGTVASSALSAVGQRVHAQLYGKERGGRELAGDVADAVSNVAHEPVRVVLADRTGVGWDEGPVSILGRASADAVGGPDRDRARYRMLVEVDGVGAFEEDTWVGQDLRLGEARVKVTNQLVRCVIITQSPATGRKDWDGLQVLAKSGRPHLCLGVIAEVVTPGEIRVGADVQVAPAV